jgi:hypothetical protein
MVTFGPAPADGTDVWWLWIVGGLIAWLVVALLVGVVLGRSVQLADRRSAAPADLSPDPVMTPAAAARRRAIPLPTFAVALVGVALALETTGFVLRLTGASGATARVLSMDAPFSLPRMYVAALFATAGVMAIAAAGRLPERRIWWMAVGLVAVGIAVVKAGGTVHAVAYQELQAAAGQTGALALSAAAALLVGGVLWFLSSTERRDRARVLGALALYAVASVGVSGVSTIAGGTYGGASRWTTGVTFVEEAGEALGGVVFLVAVLAGVAPRLVLPAAWALRRTADAHTLDAAEPLPGRALRDGLR